MVKVLIGKSFQEGSLPPEKDELLKEVEEEVEKFSTWMANLEDFRARGALNNPEKALLRTYLIQKFQGKI